MRSFLIAAGVVALTLGTSHPADAQVVVSGGYQMPRTAWVYPASAYPGGFYNPVVTSGYTAYPGPVYGTGIFAAPVYGGVIVNRPYAYGWNNTYHTGYRPYTGVNYGYGRRWRR